MEEQQHSVADQQSEVNTADVPSVPVDPKCTPDQAQAIFDTLGLRYTMKTFRYCADKAILLTDLMEFTPKNHLLLIQLGTPNLTPQEADTAIDTWMAQSGLDLPTLHVYALEATRRAGFFLSEDGMATLTSKINQKPGSLGIALPILAEGMKLYTSALESYVE